MHVVYLGRSSARDVIRGACVARRVDRGPFMQVSPEWGAAPPALLAVRQVRGT
jgi:hypothetical protein